MAKDKVKDEIKTDVPEDHPDTVRVKHLTNLLVEMAPELWRFRRILLQQDAHRAASVSAGDLYQKCRTELGEYGEKLDAFLRGAGPEPVKP